MGVMRLATLSCSLSLTQPRPPTMLPKHVINSWCNRLLQNTVWISLSLSSFMACRCIGKPETQSTCLRQLFPWHLDVITHCRAASPWFGLTLHFSSHAFIYIYLGNFICLHTASVSFRSRLLIPALDLEATSGAACWLHLELQVTGK